MTSCLLIPKYENITFKPASTVLVRVSLPRSLMEITKSWMDLGGDKQREREAKTSLGMSVLRTGSCSWMMLQTGCQGAPSCHLSAPVQLPVATGAALTKRLFHSKPCSPTTVLSGRYDTPPHKHSAAERLTRCKTPLSASRWDQLCCATHDPEFGRNWPGRLRPSAQTPLPPSSAPSCAPHSSSPKSISPNKSPAQESPSQVPPLMNLTSENTR